MIIGYTKDSMETVDDELAVWDYKLGSNGAKAVLNACASILSSSSDNMQAFQSILSGLAIRSTMTWLN
jgi:hypothetical protein